MTAARWVGAAIPATLLGAAIILAVLLLREARRARRIEALLAEQRARPPEDQAHPVLMDEVQILRGAIEHACCPGAWQPDHTYRHHDECTKEHAS